MVQDLMGGELHAGAGGRNRETTKFAALLLSPPLQQADSVLLISNKCCIYHPEHLQTSPGLSWLHAVHHIMLKKQYQT